MAELMLPNFLAAAREGQARGQQRGLASLMGQALQQPDQRQALIGKMAGTDPGAAMQAQQHFDAQAATQKKANRDRLVQLSEVMLKAPQMAAQVYPEFRASLSAELGPNVNLPEQFDPGALDAARAFVSQGQDNTPSAIRELQMLQANPELADLDMKRRTAGFDRPQLIQTDQGYAWATPQGATPLNYGAGGHTEQPNVQRALAMLAGQPGAQMTSGLRTPERNAAVGGVPNSQHLKGTAGDYAVPQAQKASFIANARQQGFEAIDEGDHVHVELPGQASSRVMPAPKASGQSEIEKRIELARQNGATEDQVRQMIIGREGAAAGAKPLPVGALRELLDVEDALGGVRNVSAIIKKHADRMTSGALDVKPEDTVGAKFRTFVGRSSANDVNITEFNADKTRIVNESLRLNKGVQTEGDAQRATQELMAANDQATAARALRRLAEINTRAAELQRQKQALIRRNYGQDAGGNPLGQRAPARPQPAQNDDDALIGKYL